ncbi:MAG: hypothetical protein PHV95_10990 [Eubacteriales bacterium]|nr:hypothetical protein [Eubacteriales bacterium]
MLNKDRYKANYKSNSNLIDSFVLNHNGQVTNTSYKYDGLERVTEATVSHNSSRVFLKGYSYAQGIDSSKTTPLISTEIFNDVGNTISYTYDNNGNITNINHSGKYISYVYDNLNQLVREDNTYSNRTYTYEYDGSGNILYKRTNAYNTGALGSVLSTDTYGYGNANWGDLLTSYNGQSIAYDEIGNPLNWRNISDLTWQGRELSSFWDAGYNTEHQYKYNENGIRTNKYIEYWAYGGFINTNYVLDGSKILKETRTGNENATLYYYYDASGSVIGFSFNGNSCYYGKNIQGDIKYIYNMSGRLLVEYSYDAWGNTISITDANGNAIAPEDLEAVHAVKYNPFRYRGYYYDSETGFYYLNSRYYDPQVGRFINADSVIADVGGEILGNNLFAYCFNNPVNLIDSEGFWPSWGQIFKAAVSVAAGAVFVAAVVASAGAVGVAAGVAAASIGATGTMVSVAISVGTGATYAVATGIGACTLSNAGEILTGTNVIRDKVMGGNYDAYNTAQTALSIVGGSAIIVGQTNPGVTGNAAKPKSNAKEMHRLPDKGTPRTSVDKLYGNKPGEFQRQYYDYNGNPSLRIDFTGHAPGSGHTNPHIHVITRE